MANNFVAQMARDPLGPVTLKYDSLLRIYYTEACRKAFQDAARNFGIVKWEHGTTAGRVARLEAHQQIPHGLQRAPGNTVWLARAKVQMFQEFERMAL